MRVNQHYPCRNEEYQKLGLDQHCEQCNENCDMKDIFTIVSFPKVIDNEF